MMNLIPLILLATSLTLKADEASDKRLERLKKRMSKSDDKKAADKPEDAKKADEKKPEEKKEEKKPEPEKTETKPSDSTKPEEHKAEDKKEDKKDEKKSEDKKPSETKDSEKKDESKKDEVKKEEPKPEDKKSDSSSSAGSAVSAEGKVDMAKVVTEDAGSTDRDWSESITKREKVEEEGNNILKKTQAESVETNQSLDKISKIHSDAASEINQTYQDYSQPVSTYIQMNEEVGKYLKTISDEKDSNVKDLAKDLEKASKEITESIDKLKKSIEEIDKLEKDNEEHFTKSQEQSVVVIKKLGEVQLAYNDISKAKTVAEAKELVTKMEAALKDCSQANKTLEECSDKIKSIAKDVSEKSGAVKSASQDTQNASEKITELMSKIEKTKLEKSSKVESAVVKNLKKMSEFVEKKKAYAQEKPTTFGMAILNFFVNVGNGVKDFFVRLFVISTNQKSHLRPAEEALAEAKKESSVEQKDDKSNKKEDKASKDDKKVESDKKEDKKDEKKDEKKGEDKKTEDKDKKSEGEKSEKDKDKSDEGQEKKKQSSSYEQVKGALDQFIESSGNLIKSLSQYISEAYSSFANKKTSAKKEKESETNS